MKLLRILVFISVNVFILNTAKAQNTDTARFYFTLDSHKPSSPSKADFVRMILPPDNHERYLNVMEYYMNGNAKMVGKSHVDPRTFVDGTIELEGDCISYYPDGKRHSIVHYVNGFKVGMEYLYRENGTLNFTLNHKKVASLMFAEELYWDFYDEAGKQLCKDGNGEWTRYDDEGNFKEQGLVKNGLPDGEWKGSPNLLPSIRYTREYKKGKLLSCIGYDSAGKAYPFKIDIEPAKYNNETPFYLVEILHGYFKIPNEANGEKLSPAIIHFSLIVEKDGSITNAEILESKDSNSTLNNNLKEALQKCEKWTPTIYYGVPVRTKLYYDYKESEDYKVVEKTDNSVSTTINGIYYRVELLD